MSNLVTITEDQFFDQFKPIKNHLAADAAYDGYMFETYGKEYEHVNAQLKINPLTVWTLLEGDDGNCHINQGWHYVNRIGYFITMMPAEDGTQYTILNDQVLGNSEVVVIDINTLGEMLLRLTEGDDEPENPEPMLMAFNNVIEHCVNEAEYFLTGDGSDTINHQEISLHISKLGSMLRALLVEYDSSKQFEPDFKLYEYIETNLLIKI